MATVLVTGGNGVIGSWACRELVQRGARVVILDRRATAAVSFGESDGPKCWVGDLRDTGLIRSLIAEQEITAVLHLAAIIGEAAERDPSLAIEVNALATARLLEVFRQNGAGRFVAMSTKGVLGVLDARYLHPTYEAIPEDLPAHPDTIYETTKAVVEGLIRRDRSREGSSAVVRLSTTWGPGKTAESHAGFSLHSDVVSRAMRGASSHLDLHPDQAHDLIYYGDVARGLADLCLVKEELASPVYHLGSGSLVTAAEFAAAVEAAFPGVRVTLGQQPAAGRNCLLGIAAARRDIGYRPVYTLDRALNDVRQFARG